MTTLPEMLKSFDDKFPRLVISINESPIGFRDERVEADGIVMRNFLTEVWNSAYIAGLEEAKVKIKEVMEKKDANYLDTSSP
jgi:hypothetical protein